jgi:hypothetical protein
VRQGRDLVVNEALLSVRRMLRQEQRQVAAAFDQAAGQDGCLGSMQMVELLQQLMPGVHSPSSCGVAVGHSPYHSLACLPQCVFSTCMSC